MFLWLVCLGINQRKTGERETPYRRAAGNQESAWIVRQLSLGLRKVVRMRSIVLPLLLAPVVLGNMVTFGDIWCLASHENPPPLPPPPPTCAANSLKVYTSNDGIDTQSRRARSARVSYQSPGLTKGARLLDL